MWLWSCLHPVGTYAPVMQRVFFLRFVQFCYWESCRMCPCPSLCRRIQQPDTGSDNTVNLNTTECVSVRLHCVDRLPERCPLYRVKCLASLVSWCRGTLDPRSAAAVWIIHEKHRRNLVTYSLCTLTCSTYNRRRCLFIQSMLLCTRATQQGRTKADNW